MVQRKKITPYFQEFQRTADGHSNTIDKRNECCINATMGSALGIAEDEVVNRNRKVSFRERQKEADSFAPG